MPYQGKLLKEVFAGAVYRKSTNGKFYLVRGFKRVRNDCMEGEHEDKWDWGIEYVPVQYVRVDDGKAHLRKGPEFRLRVMSNHDVNRYVMKATMFMDKFFLHHTKEQAPVIEYVRSDVGGVTTVLVGEDVEGR